MKIQRELTFEFSGCDYHPPPPQNIAFGLEVGKAFLREAGFAEPSRYQAFLMRDLILEFARDAARDFRNLEREVRADVKSRRGFEEYQPQETEVQQQQAVA